MNRITSRVVLAVFIGCGSGLTATEGATNLELSVVGVASHYTQQETVYEAFEDTVKDFAKHETVYELDRLAVDRQKSFLNSYLTKNKNERFAMRLVGVAGMCATVGYFAYSKFGPKMSAPDVIPVSATTIAEIAEDVKTLKGFAVQQALKDTLPKVVEAPVVQPVVSDSYIQTIKDYGNWVGSSVYGGAKFMLHFMSHQGLVVAIGAVGSSLAFREFPTSVMLWNKFISAPMDAIFHPIDSVWFTSKHSNVEQTFDEVYQSVEVLPLFAKNEFDRPYYVKSTIETLNLLTRRLASLVAFMEVQSERVKVQNRACSKKLSSIAEHVFSSVQKFNRETVVLLADVESFEKLPALVQTLQNVLQEERRKFHMWERALLYDIVPADEDDEQY